MRTLMSLLVLLLFGGALLGLVVLRPDAERAGDGASDSKSERAPEAKPVLSPFGAIEEAKALERAWAQIKAGKSQRELALGDFDGALKNLAAIPPDAPEAKEAAGLAKKLEAAKREWTFHAARALGAKIEAARKEYAQSIENNFLKAGMDVHVTAIGDRATVLRIKYVLILENAKRMWFSKVELTDGRTTWTYDLMK